MTEHSATGTATPEPKLCYAPPDQIPHPPHEWVELVRVTAGDRWAGFRSEPRWCDGWAGVVPALAKGIAPRPPTAADRAAAAADALARQLRAFGRQGPAAIGWGATPAEIVALVAPYLTVPAEPADEVQCPACGATIRARMSDADQWPADADDRVLEGGCGD